MGNLSGKFSNVAAFRNVAASSNVATEEAQAARYEQLKGKNLLWLSCHYAARMYPTLKPMIKGVVDLGVCLHACVGNTDADRAFAKQMTEDGLASGIVFADMLDDSRACDNIFAAVTATGVKYDAVFSPHEVVQTLIGELSERLGLPGNTKAAYVKARDKHLCRVACEAKHIPSPRYAPITLATMDKVIEDVGLPMVLKPSSGSGSEGIYKCCTAEEVRQRLLQLTEDMAHSMTISWTPGLDLCILSEEYLDGSEFDVDMLMWNGKVVYANIIDNWPTMEPTFLETASNCPSTYSPALQAQLVDFAYECVAALGFKQGCFHVELKYSMHPKRLRVGQDGETLGQPMLLEVNPRMGGGRTHYFHKHVYNVDLFDNFLMTTFGIAINPPVSPEPLTCLADYDICAPRSGVLLHNRWLDHIKDHAQVVSQEMYMKPGAQVKGADVGVPQWVGMLMLKGSTPQEVCATLQAFMDSVDIPIAQVGDKTASAMDGGEVVGVLEPVKTAMTVPDSVVAIGVA